MNEECRVKGSVVFEREEEKNRKNNFEALMINLIYDNLSIRLLYYGLFNI